MIKSLRLMLPSPPDLPDPLVTIFGLTTGMEFHLSCSVSVVEYLITQPTVQWSRGSVNSGDSMTESNTTVNGVTNMRTLTFNPLHISHGAARLTSTYHLLVRVELSWYRVSDFITDQHTHVGAL